jgi:hypothetical protein
MVMSTLFLSFVNPYYTLATVNDPAQTADTRAISQIVQRFLARSQDKEGNKTGVFIPFAVRETKLGMFTELAYQEIYHIITEGTERAGATSGINSKN